MSSTDFGDNAAERLLEAHSEGRTCLDCEHFRKMPHVTTDKYGRNTHREMVSPRCVLAKDMARHGYVLIPSFIKTCDMFFVEKL